jgi:hypothetical protein
VFIAGGDEPRGDGGGCAMARRAVEDVAAVGSRVPPQVASASTLSFLRCFVNHLRRWKRLLLLFLLQREVMWRWRFGALCEVSYDTFIGSLVGEVDGMRFFMFMPRFCSPSSLMVQLRVPAVGSLRRQIRNPQAGSVGGVVGGAVARCFWLFCESVDGTSYGDADKFFWSSDVRQPTAADDFSSPVLLKMVADACSTLTIRLNGVVGCEFLRHFQCLTPLVKDGGGCTGSPIDGLEKVLVLRVALCNLQFSKVFYIK